MYVLSMIYSDVVLCGLLIVICFVSFALCFVLIALFMFFNYSFYV
jgi:hypothetical protein